MLIFKTASQAGYNDFLPSLKSIYVRDGNIVLFDWHTYRSWLPLLIVWDIVVLLLVCHEVHSYISNSGNRFATPIAAAYLVGIGLRRTLTKRLDVKLGNVVAVVSAPRIAWIDSFVHSFFNLVVACLTVLLAKGYWQIAAIVLPVLAIADMLLPFVNLYKHRSPRHANWIRG